MRHIRQKGRLASGCTSRLITLCLHDLQKVILALLLFIVLTVVEQQVIDLGKHDLRNDNQRDSLEKALHPGGCPGDPGKPGNNTPDHHNDQGKLGLKAVQRLIPENIGQNSQDEQQHIEKMRIAKGAAHRKGKQVIQNDLHLTV